jgi:hypothetical protein
MKKTKIIFWVTTIILAGMLGFGAIFDALSVPEAVEHVTNLGYPAYLVPFLGIAKIAGVIVILIPKYARIKEWAYAGLVFDLTGAMFSHAYVGDPLSMWLPLLIPILLIASSYIYYHKLFGPAGELNIAK